MPENQTFKHHIWTKCPHCKFMQAQTLVLDGWTTWHNITCDTEEGGCDKHYMITVTVKYVVVEMALDDPGVAHDEMGTPIILEASHD
jgi:hypothetical protein